MKCRFQRCCKLIFHMFLLPGPLTTNIPGYKRRIFGQKLCNMFSSCLNFFSSWGLWVSRNTLHCCFVHLVFSCKLQGFHVRFLPLQCRVAQLFKKTFESKLWTWWSNMVKSNLYCAHSSHAFGDVCCWLHGECFQCRCYDDLNIF